MAMDEQQLAVQRIKDPGKRKAAYYKLQRENAEEGGDQATTDKIYGKLGKKSHNVDSARGDKAILAVAPFLPEAAEGLGEVGAARVAMSEGMAIRNAYHGIPKAGEEVAEGISKVTSKIPKRMEAPKVGPKKYSSREAEVGGIKNPKLKQAMGGKKTPPTRAGVQAATAVGGAKTSSPREMARRAGLAGGMAATATGRIPSKKGKLSAPKKDAMTKFEKSHRVRSIS
jgi:hypothetical protein